MFKKLQDLDEWLLKKSDQWSEWMQTEKGIPLPTILAASIWAIYLMYAIMMLSWSMQMNRTLFVFMAGINTLCWAKLGWDYYKTLDVYAKHAEQFEDNEELRQVYSALALTHQQMAHAWRIYMVMIVFYSFVIGVVSALLDNTPGIRAYNFPDVLFLGSVGLYGYLQCTFPRIPRKGRKLVLAKVTT